MINTREVASFIGNVIVKIEEEEEYDKIVDEIIKILVKNNLYIKPEKYKQKVREIEFLGVIIELDEIKIEKEKIRKVLNWLTLQRVKDIQKFLKLANYYQQFIKDFVYITRLLYNVVKRIRSRIEQKSKKIYSKS